MKKRFGMLFVIICILCVGISVTRMTKDYVTSHGGSTNSLFSEKKEEAAETVHLKGSLTSVTKLADADSETIEEIENTKPETFVEPAAAEAVSAAENVPAYGPGMAAPIEIEFAQPEAAPAAHAESIEEENVDIENPGVEMTIEETFADQNKNSEMTPHVVKSPLDPATDDLVPDGVNGTLEQLYDAEDFFERFENAELNSVKLWENTSSDNIAAYAAAAEQERVLWDYELNFIYGEIRKRMEPEEAEELKHLELDWIKERDHYAERMAQKVSGMNAQNQNPTYTRALAEKTKERCYWLAFEYEEVLNRDASNLKVRLRK